MALEVLAGRWLSEYLLGCARYVKHRADAPVRCWICREKLNVGRRLATDDGEEFVAGMNVQKSAEL